MKRHLHCVRAAALGWAAAVVMVTLPAGAVAQGFEGAITFRTIDDDGKATEMKQITKGKKLRVEGMGGDKGGAWVLDQDQGRMLMIDPKRKQVMVMTRQDMEQMRAMGAAMRKQQGQGEKPAAEDYKLDFKPTGESRTVAGVRCQVWRGYTEQEGEREEGEACLADGVGFAMFDLMDNPMLGGGQGSKMEREFARYRKIVGPNKGVVQTAEIKNGKPVVQLEATKIERGPVSDAQFQPPPGYTVVNMGEMLKKSQR